MTKILAISPSGEVYNHDCVHWYSRSSFALKPDHYHNIGDAFVYDSSLKLMRFKELDGLNIRNPSDAEIDRYNSEFDFAFLRGSNYLHPEMDWENAPSVLSRLRNSHRRLWHRRASAGKGTTEPDQRCSSRARLYRRAVRIARRAWHVHGRGALVGGDPQRPHRWLPDHLPQ